MPVYMIQVGYVGPVKIGHTNDPQKRLTELQVAHYERLRILRLFEGGAVEEAMLHLRFADLHMRGEWHGFSRAMLGDLGFADFVATKAESRLTLDEILLILGGDGAVAAHLGCGQPAISNWKARGVPPRRQLDLVDLSRRMNVHDVITLEEVRAASDEIADKITNIRRDAVSNLTVVSPDATSA